MSEPRTLVELFEQRPSASTAPFIEGLEGLASYTYEQAWAMAAQVAHALTEHRVRPGDRVAMQVAKTSEALIVYLACLRSGAVLVPLNPGATEAELHYLLGDAVPTLVIADPTLVAARSPLPVVTLDSTGGGTLLESAAPQPASAPSFSAKPDTPAAMVYTSGTTGRPKGAIVSHRNLTSNALTLAQAWGFGADDRLLHLLPIFHVHGLFVATNCTIAGGGALVLAPRFDVDIVLEQLPRCTVMMGVPTFYTRLLADHRFDGETCRSARLLISGSAPLLASTHAEFEQRTGHTILERYGMSETSMLTSNPLHGTRKPGTVGPALAGVSVRVVDSRSGDPLATGEVGDIEVRGPNVFGGYWRRPELNDTEFTVDGYFRTGDVGVFDADGYLTIVGREKDLIITGGLNVYPKEIEEAINALPGVAASAVIGVPDADFGEAVVAVVVGDARVVLDPDALRDSLRIVLAAYKVPKQIHLVDALPQNAMGKVEKAKLRDAFA
jgi:malonyl-CoA/methylmalonyl-CoA synthetase